MGDQNENMDDEYYSSDGDYDEENENGEGEENSGNYEDDYVNMVPVAESIFKIEETTEEQNVLIEKLSLKLETIQNDQRFYFLLWVFFQTSVLMVIARMYL